MNIVVFSLVQNGVPDWRLFARHKSFSRFLLMDGTLKTRSLCNEIERSGCPTLDKLHEHLWKSCRQEEDMLEVRRVWELKAKMKNLPLPFNFAEIFAPPSPDESPSQVALRVAHGFVLWWTKVKRSDARRQTCELFDPHQVKLALKTVKTEMLSKKTLSISARKFGADGDGIRGDFHTVLTETFHDCGGFETLFNRLGKQLTFQERRRYMVMLLMVDSIQTGNSDILRTLIKYSGKKFGTEASEIFFEASETFSEELDIPPQQTMLEEHVRMNRGIRAWVEYMKNALERSPRTPERGEFMAYPNLHEFIWSAVDNIRDAQREERKHRRKMIPHLFIS